jgi:hypothetical protein
MKTFFAVLLYVLFASSVVMAQNAPPVGGSAPAVTAPANNPPVGGSAPAVTAPGNNPPVGGSAPAVTAPGNNPPVVGSAPAVTAPANNPPVVGSAPAVTAPAKTLTVNYGKLTKLQGKSLTITQKVKPAVIVLTVDDKTKFHKLLDTVMPNGGDFQKTVKSSLDALAPGQHVWVQYVADTKVVLEIQILPDLLPGHGRLVGE